MVLALYAKVLGNFFFAHPLNSTGKTLIVLQLSIYLFVTLEECSGINYLFNVFAILQNILVFFLHSEHLGSNFLQLQTSITSPAAETGTNFYYNWKPYIHRTGFGWIDV